MIGYGSDGSSPDMMWFERLGDGIIVPPYAATILQPPGCSVAHMPSTQCAIFTSHEVP